MCPPLTLSCRCIAWETASSVCPPTGQGARDTVLTSGPQDFLLMGSRGGAALLRVWGPGVARASSGADQAPELPPWPLHPLPTSCIPPVRGREWPAVWVGLPRASAGGAGQGTRRVQRPPCLVSDGHLCGRDPLRCELWTLSAGTVGAPLLESWGSVQCTSAQMDTESPGVRQSCWGGRRSGQRGHSPCSPGSCSSGGRTPAPLGMR